MLAVQAVLDVSEESMEYSLVIDSVCAVESVKWAFTASISRGFVMILLSAFTMSAAWGMTGIWLAFPAAEFITMGMTFAGVWGFFSKVNLVGKSL